MKNRNLCCVSIAIVLCCSSPVLGQSQRFLTVSPGATDRLTGVEARCPTFSWQATPGAVAYEVVVYRLPVETDFAAWSLDEAMEVLFVELPTGVTAWTPPLEKGLARGSDHVWFVRAVFEDAGLDEVNDTEWSEARFFRVVGGVTQTETRLVTGERVGDSGAGPGTTEVSSRGKEIEAGRNAMARRMGEATTKDVSTAMAAIRGEMPDVTGETYGVVGTSNSPDGAGLGAVNTAGGPDLVLDGGAQGVPNADFSESGVDRAASTAQSFDFTNSDTGSMTLQVDGVEVVTALTDQDTLAGLSCGSNEVAKWSGGLWICAPDIDTNIDTLAGLSCGTGGIAKWNGSSWACAPDGDTLAALSCARNEIARWNGMDWACTPDENTTYMFGTGLTYNGSQIVVDPGVFAIRLTTLDSAGDVGSASSITIGADLRGLISYFDFTNGDLKVAHCSDPACTSAAVSTVDSDGEVGNYSSVAIGTDGLGLIAYYARDPFYNLKVAHCSDFFCSSATVGTLDTAGEVGEFPSVAIGTDGFGLISYYDSTNGDLKVAHCVDTACTVATVGTLDAADDVGDHTSVAIGADGLGLISYRDRTHGDLKVAHCIDTACTSATISTLDPSNTAGQYTSVTIGADGLGLISYGVYQEGDLKVAHCDNVACTSATLSNLDSAGNVDLSSTSIAIGVDGLGLISYVDESNNELKVAHCKDLVCTIAVINTVDRSDGANAFGYGTSLAIGADGLGLLSYSDAINDDLRVAHLPITY